MPTYFLTGATGTVGRQVLEALLARETTGPIILAGRRLSPALETHQDANPQLEYRTFDFKDPSGFERALRGVDRVFFMRPPQLARKATFAPFVAELARQKIELVTFLSVAGAERAKFLPHAKIERLLDEAKLPTYVVRPEYFMSNLIEVFASEIKNHHRLSLPSARAQFNWIAPQDIGEVIALSLLSPSEFTRQATHLTGKRNLEFSQVCTLLSEVLGYHVEYRAVNPLRYFWSRPHARSSLEAFLFTLIHTAPRLLPAPVPNNRILELTGHEPTSLVEFLRKHREAFVSGQEVLR